MLGVGFMMPFIRAPAAAPGAGTFWGTNRRNDEPTKRSEDGAMKSERKDKGMKAKAKRWLGAVREWLADLWMDLELCAMVLLGLLDGSLAAEEREAEAEAEEIRGWEEAA